MKHGKIVAVATNLAASDAIKALDLSSYVVIPGIIDIHGHVYASAKDSPSFAQDISLCPDGFTLRHGVTTIVDAGGSGWKSFDDFKARIVDKSKTRVLAMINIVGEGMRGTVFEDNLEDMDGVTTATSTKNILA